MKKDFIDTILLRWKFSNCSPVILYDAEKKVFVIKDDREVIVGEGVYGPKWNTLDKYQMLTLAVRCARADFLPIDFRKEMAEKLFAALFKKTKVRLTGVERHTLDWAMMGPDEFKEWKRRKGRGKKQRDPTLEDALMTGQARQVPKKTAKK